MPKSKKRKLKKPKLKDYETYCYALEVINYEKKMSEIPFGKTQEEYFKNLDNAEITKMIKKANDLPGCLGVNSNMFNNDIFEMDEPKYLRILYDTPIHRNEAYNILNEGCDEKNMNVALIIYPAIIDKRYLKNGM